jgi:hypothetical protein
VTEQDEIMVELAHLQESNKSIQELKTYKAPGIGNIPAEIYKVGGNILKLQID